MTTVDELADSTEKTTLSYRVDTDPSPLKAVVGAPPASLYVTVTNGTTQKVTPTRITITIPIGTDEHSLTNTPINIRYEKPYNWTLESKGTTPDNKAYEFRFKPDSDQGTPIDPEKIIGFTLSNIAVTPKAGECIIMLTEQIGMNSPQKSRRTVTKFSGVFHIISFGPKKATVNRNEEATVEWNVPGATGFTVIWWKMNTAGNVVPDEIPLGATTKFWKTPPLTESTPILVKAHGKSASNNEISYPLATYIQVTRGDIQAGKLTVCDTVEILKTDPERRDDPTLKLSNEEYVKYDFRSGTDGFLCIRAREATNFTNQTSILSITTFETGKPATKELGINIPLKSVATIPLKRTSTVQVSRVNDGDGDVGFEYYWIPLGSSQKVECEGKKEGDT